MLQWLLKPSEGSNQVSRQDLEARCGAIPKPLPKLGAADAAAEEPIGLDSEPSAVMDQAEVKEQVMDPTEVKEQVGHDMT